MEASPPQGGAEAEECSSSESGWTMYLASPVHGGSNSDGFDDAVVDDEGEVDGPSVGTKSRGEEAAAAAAAAAAGGGAEEEDDSMTSDASSGTPGERWRRHGPRHGKEKGGHCCSKCCGGNGNQKAEKAGEKGALSSRPASARSNSNSKK